jgi:Ca2+:H+ antiporter
MSSETKNEDGLGPPHASTSVPRISIDGPNNLPVDADFGNNTQETNLHTEKSPGMLEAGGGPGSNLKKRKLTVNGSNNNIRDPTRSQTASTGQTDVGWLHALLHPKRDPEALQPPSIARCFFNILKYSYLNILLIMIPIGWAVHFANLNDTLVFVFNFLAIIPLAALLGFATEELALRVGPTLGGMNISHREPVNRNLQPFDPKQASSMPRFATG